MQPVADSKPVANSASAHQPDANAQVAARAALRARAHAMSAASRRAIARDIAREAARKVAAKAMDAAHAARKANLAISDAARQLETECPRCGGTQKGWRNIFDWAGYTFCTAYPCIASEDFPARRS